MHWILVILSGVIVAFGQPAWAPWLAPAAAICGYALFWHAISKEASPKYRFLLSTGWFAAVQLVQLSWMTSIEYQGVYILAVYGLVAVALGLQFGVLTHMIGRIPLVASASLWALIEWSRVHVLCGFSFNPVGLALTALPFSLQTVSFFGIFGLSFWVILTNLALWKKKWMPAALLALCPYLAGGVLWAIHQSRLETSPHIDVALVQTALQPSQKMYFPERAADFIDPYEQWERITQLLSCVKQRVDLVVLPESAIPYTDRYPLYSKNIVQNILQTSFRKKVEEGGPAQAVSNRYWIQAVSHLMDADVVVGLDGDEGAVQYSSAFFASRGDQGHKGKMHRYDKQVLLPLAEYLPFQSLRVLTKNYGITQFFTHGKQSTIFHSKVPISTSICYEETFGHIMRQGRNAGAKLFVNVTNDNWYPNSRLPQQHFDLARAQAVANGTPLVRACNAGVTSALDSMGSVIAQLSDWNSPSVLVASVPLYQIWTFYSFWGDQGIIFVSILFLLLAIIINKKSLFVSLLIKKQRKER